MLIMNEKMDFPSGLQQIANLAFDQFHITRTDVHFREILYHPTALGCCDVIGKHILIRSGRPMDEMLETLAHEIAHSQHVCHTGWHALMTRRIHFFLRDAVRGLGVPFDIPKTVPFIRITLRSIAV